MEVWPSLITPTTGTPTASRSSTAILGPAGEQAAGLHDDAGQAVADHPQHLMADIRLQPIKRQNDPALRGQPSPQGLALHQSGGQQFIVAVEQVGDAALGNVD